MHGMPVHLFTPMTQLLVSWLVLSLAFWFTARLLPGFHVRSFGSAVFVAAVFGIINTLLGWLFFRHLPDLLSLMGMLVIVGSSLSIAYAEKIRRETAQRDATL